MELKLMLKRHRNEYINMIMLRQIFDFFFSVRKKKKMKKIHVRTSNENVFGTKHTEDICKMKRNNAIYENFLYPQHLALITFSKFRSLLLFISLPFAFVSFTLMFTILYKNNFYDIARRCDCVGFILFLSFLFDSRIKIWYWQMLVLSFPRLFLVIDKFFNHRNEYRLLSSRRMLGVGSKNL